MMPRDHTNKGKRILVVDDDAAVRDSIRVVLTLDRYKVEIAADSETALRLYDASRFDVVIVDYNMPGINGLELSRLIRAGNPAQQVLLVSGNLEGMPRSVGALEHFTNILEKPFSVETLRAAVAASFRPA